MELLKLNVQVHAWPDTMSVTIEKNTQLLNRDDAISVETTDAIGGLTRQYGLVPVEDAPDGFLVSLDEIYDNEVPTPTVKGALEADNYCLVPADEVTEIKRKTISPDGSTRLKRREFWLNPPDDIDRVRDLALEECERALDALGRRYRLAEQGAANLSTGEVAIRYLQDDRKTDGCVWVRTVTTQLDDLDAILVGSESDTEEKYASQLRLDDLTDDEDDEPRTQQTTLTELRWRS